MWAKPEELGLTDDSTLFRQHNGILFFNARDLSAIPNKIDIAETIFLKSGHKTHDISGYTTGIGLGVKDVFKLMKKKNATRFKSDFTIYGTKKCLDTIINDVIQIYPCKALDNISSKVFFSISEVPISEQDFDFLDNPYCLELETERQLYYFNIHFLK